MNEHPIDLLPELILLGGAIAGLLLGLYLPRRFQGLVAVLAATCAVTAAAAAGWQWAGPVRMAFEDSYRVDDLTSAVRVTITVSLLLLLALARARFAGDPRESEVYVLMLLAALGAITLAGAHDLMLLMGAYTLASVPLYALVAFVKDAAGTEAGVKYYLMGALFGLVMLAGIVVLYGLAGSTAYPALTGPLDSAARGPLTIAVVTLIAGLSFKAGAVPAHFWVPDVAEGTSTAVAAFVTTVPKIGALAALFRLVDGPLHSIEPDWRLLIAVIATASMSLGNLAAFFQNSPRRLLAYSTISQVGYLLLPVVAAGDSGLAQKALLFYLAAYALTNIGAFAVVAAHPTLTRIPDYRGLARRSPLAVAGLSVCLLGLLGTPPLAVFVGKLSVFSAAVDAHYEWLAVIAALNTVASLFYYLRWIAVMFARPPRQNGSDRDAAVHDRLGVGWPLAISYLAAASTLALGLSAGLLLT